ncbi:MAG: UvrD-helicase domain-containing protein [Planctomycetia bacterium]|nr:UvrD-helicase domain-containing protein [Planctomycetia bacterium]
MDRKFKNEVIKASAGSGKTFQLSNRYIHLLLSGVPVERILATTFTRKAAGEIFDRILSRLGKAAASEEAVRNLSKEIFGNPEVLQRQSLERLLADLARNLYKIRVSTLDSFFMKLIRNFSMEVGLPDSWKIVDESYQTRLINQAIRAALENTPRNTAIRLMYLLFQGETSRNFQKQIFNLANSLLDILYQSKPDAWEKLPHSKGPDPQDLNAALNDLQTAIDTNNLPKTSKGELNTPFLKAVQKVLAAGESGSWENLADAKLILSVLDHSLIFSRVDFSSLSQLVQALEIIVEQVRVFIVNPLSDQTRATRSLLEQIGSFLKDLKFNEGAYRFADFPLFLEGKLAADQIIHRLDAKTEHLLLDEFQDTSPLQWRIIEQFANLILAPNRQPGDHSSFFCVGDRKQAIYGWRGGVAGILDHVETLPNIDPPSSLLSNWRSSPIIIDTVNQIFRNLLVNPVLCGALRGNPYENQEVLSSAAGAWSSKYEEHQSSPKTKDLKGYCSLESAPLFLDEDLHRGDVRKYLDLISGESEEDPDSGESPDCGSGSEEIALKEFSGQKGLTLGYSISRIMELHKDHPEATIGVLTRSNDMIGKIVSLLRKQGIECSEEGGTALANSPAVKAVFSFLKIADHPGNTIALFHVASTPPFSKYFGIDENNYNDREVGERLSSLIRNKILSNGLSRVVNALAEILAPSCDSRDQEHLGKLVELACQQEENNLVRIDTFLDSAQTMKFETPSASKIRVMTIHKSKGLEFDIVVLPQLDNSITPKQENVITYSAKITDPYDVVVRWIAKEKKSWVPGEFRYYLDLFMQRKFEEEFCNLYVAITRAARQLVMIVSPEKSEAPEDSNYAMEKAAREAEKKSASKKNEPYSAHTNENILRAALVKSASPESPNDPFYPSVLWSLGDPDWDDARVDSLDDHQIGKKEEAQTDPLSPDGQRSVFPEIKNDLISEIFGESKEDPDSPPEHAPSWKSGHQWTDPGKFTYGTAIHRCFEEIEWLDDHLPDPDLLRSVLVPILFQEELIESTIQDFYASCEKPAIRSLLTFSEYNRPGPTPVHVRANIHNPRWLVERERPFSGISKSGSVSRGIMDRLVLLYDGNRVVGADIIDFKTDRLFDPQGNLIDPEMGNDLFEHYQNQLNEYAKRISWRYSLDFSHISRRLAFVSCDRVVEVSGSPLSGS